MMHVNFFERKKINLLPYIIGGLFIVFLTVIGVYLFFARTNYQNVIDEKNTWLNDNSEHVVLSRQINRLDDLTNESVMAQEILEENQYPMYELTTDLASTVPNEQDRIVSFSLTDPTQVSLVLENTEASLAQSIVEELEEKAYVEEVEFVSATTQNPEENDMRFELMIQINADNLVEEETE